MSVPKDHPFPFDPTYGLDLDALQAVRAPEAPPGYDSFWSNRYGRAMAVHPRPELRPGSAFHPSWVVYDITFTSTDGVVIGGWLMVPSGGEIRRGLVMGHGYGGRDQPDFDLPLRNTAVLFPCFRGLSRSARPDIPSEPFAHVLHRIGDRDSYVIGGCVDDVWTAVSALLALYPGLAGRIGYAGSSFGGGVGAMAIAFDPRIDRGHLAVPTFGNRPLWLSLPTIGSGQSVQRHVGDHPSVAEALRYFDAAVSAGRIAVPMLLAVALFDPAVAPPCQFSVANALRPSKFNEYFILSAGHFDYPDAARQHAALRARIGQFFEVT